MSPARRKQLLTLAISLFLVGGLAALTVFNLRKPRLLVVHSMSPAAVWTAEVDRGIRASLGASRLPVAVTTEYLNFDLLDFDADLQALARGVRGRIRAVDPDVLVVVDDESSDLIGRHYADAGRPVLVYTGILGDPRGYGYRKPGVVHGFRERLPLSALSTLLEVTHGTRPLKLAVLGAATLTGRAELDQVLGHEWRPHEVVVSMLASNFNDWKAFVQGQAGQADVLLVLSLDNLGHDAGDGRAVPESTVARWTEAHSQPLAIGLVPSYVRSGGALSVAPPAFLFGQRAADRALRLLEGKFRPSDAENEVWVDAYDIAVRESALNRRGIRLPRMYLEAARGAGQHFP